MLRVANLVKQYINEAGERKGGVSGVSFDVKEGELFTLLGPSGCGKTTTLRSIAGLEHPDSGLIQLAGRDLFDSRADVQLPMYERDIGMVFQSYAIWPHMSVFENAAYPLRTRRNGHLSREEIESRVMRSLEMVGLSEYRNRSATKLSGGQQQRLALARALVREPKLLLLDEPLSNLDALLREQMRSEIKRLQSEWGVTTIYVTHDQSEAMALSDRVAVLNNGVIAQMGTPIDIYDRPRCEFVANFIGRTNLLRGKLASQVRAGDIAAVHTSIGTIRCMFSSSMTAGHQISFVIRPENIELQPLNGILSDAAPNSVNGHIQGKVFLGEVAEYTIGVDGDQNLIARTHPSIGLNRGDRVRASFPEHKVIAICD
ncbi:ABC transporter ATP-binding protein [Sinorhizobium mexicanum]|uniref:ABC transporter ATP-binding protein n=1 Tax=Sinorhizobium mexicanum TaxID=375549 RepID=A0A859QGW8_9HYPH|nr:ABC transporter ATP-binding protein [Sinorhizobium mexicanum]MBP1881981.1 iron(III) transport system ATP-binding protein [Sinorhizobium mexicanum]QLL61715.1 ABC transporter ATP-binding protein [Sinorhizobium mexicanum]